MCPSTVVMSLDRKIRIKKKKKKFDDCGDFDAEGAMAYQPPD